MTGPVERTLRLTELEKTAALAEWIGEVWREYFWWVHDSGDVGSPMSFDEWLGGYRYRYRALSLVRRLRRQRNEAIAKRKARQLALADWGVGANGYDHLGELANEGCTCGGGGPGGGCGACQLYHAAKELGAARDDALRDVEWLQKHINELMDLHLDDEAIIERQRDHHRETLRLLARHEPMSDSGLDTLAEREPWLLEDE